MRRGHLRRQRPLWGAARGRPEGGKVFLCDECYARLRAVQGGRVKPTEEDLRVIAANGGMIGIGFLGGGGGF
jgi:hypothetical protein